MERLIFGGNTKTIIEHFLKTKSFETLEPI